MKDRAYFSSSRNEIQRLIPDRVGVTLDIGCGAGQFSKDLKSNMGVRETWGVELDINAAKKASQYIDRVLCGGVEDLLDEVPDNYFDCIFFNDILEHLVNPWAVLATVRKKLVAGGTVVASIPNIRHYKTLYSLIFQGEWRYQDAGVLDQTHLRFFTKKSMLRLFDENGFEVRDIAGINGTRKVKIRILGPLSFGLLSDIKFTQFSIVAVRKPS